MLCVVCFVRQMGYFGCTATRRFRRIATAVKLRAVQGCSGFSQGGTIEGAYRRITAEVKLTSDGKEQNRLCVLLLVFMGVFFIDDM